MSVAEKTLITAEQFLRMPNKGFELVDGEIRPTHGGSGDEPMSALSGWVGTRIVIRLGAHVEVHRLGWVFGADNGIQCFPWNSKLVRKPDGTFVKLDRLRPEEIHDGWLKVVPDLVVEVVSPHDTVYELEGKIGEFRRAGVPLIWVVTPPTRSVRVLRADGTTTLLHEGDELSGEGVVPGFACRVADLFLPATPGPEPDQAG